MTEENLLEKMNQQVLDEVKKSGWWIFNKKTIKFGKTELVDECNIQTIQQLPDNISFPKKTDQVVIDSKGIKSFSSFYSWADICATGIKKETIPMEYVDNYKTSILVGLNNSRIIEIEISDNIQYLNQVGHLIELYKRKFKTTTQTIS